MNQREVTKIYLKNGKEVVVTLQEGVKAREAKARGTGSFVISSQKNRMIDVAMMGEIEDVFIEDVQVQLGEQLKAERIEAQKKESTEFNPDGPGYKKYLEAKAKLAQKMKLKQGR